MAGEGDINSKHNAEVISHGNWIDTAFLVDVLRTSLQDQGIKVLNYKVAAAVGVGDNYFAILYRTTVEYTTSGSDEPKTKQLIVKGVPSSEFIRELIDEMGIFNKEITMYNTVLPVMHRYIKEYITANSVHVAPESYLCSRENTLVMEDLTETGYQMANRRNQLDLEHTMATLRTLARFHALAVKLDQEDPDMVKNVSIDFYDQSNRERMEPFLEMTFKALSTAAETWGENARFVPCLLQIGQCIYDKVAHMIAPRYTFNVLNHGDMWVNNIMFKHDEDGNIIGTKLVDFQMTRYTTPAIDLQYFFSTSPQPEVLSSHLEDLLLAYHEALTADLAILGLLDVEYTFQQLQDDMLETATFGVLAMGQILPIIVAPPAETFVMDTMNPEEIAQSNDPDSANPMTKNYRNAHYRDVAVQYLMHKEAVGYLDAAKERMQFIVEAAEASKKKSEGEITENQAEAA